MGIVFTNHNKAQAGITNPVKQYEPADFKVFEHWVYDYLTNWTDCDTLCNHTIASFVMMYPEYISELKNGQRLKKAPSIQKEKIKQYFFPVGIGNFNIFPVFIHR